MPAIITGWGNCVPPAVATNHDLAQIMDTSDEWIVERTGISERHVSHVGSGELGVVAAQRALAAAGREPNDVDALIFASVSPELLVPSTASLVQKRMGIKDVAAMDLNVGCSGFVYGLAVANGLITSGVCQCVLLIASERLTWYLDWTLRDTAVLFGDGSGAVVMEAGGDDEGVLWAEMGNDGAAADALMVPNFGTSMDRIRHDMLDITVQFDGREIFRRAVKGMTQSGLSVLSHAGYSIDDVQLMIPHQANRRIIDAAGHKLGIDPERVYVNVDRFGNTSAASIPIALAEAMEHKRINAGDLVLFTAFGAGLSRGAALLRWGPRAEPLGVSDAELPPCDATGLEIIRRHAEPMQARAAARAAS
ncbi:MAG: ketoacyl-ACP synthase III [Chromatiales bacterium]|nr:MAG: ketoacyl-ACP synthase III [Chromatiales bacterium]